jgi:hypothetical protein
MLYPLSYEGLRCPFALDTGRVSVRWARAGYLAPDGLCRTCAACSEPASDRCHNTRRRLYGWWRQTKGWRSRSDAVEPLTRVPLAVVISGVLAVVPVVPGSSRHVGNARERLPAEVGGEPAE